MKREDIEELKKFIYENPEAGTDELIDTACEYLFGDSSLPTAVLIMELLEEISGDKSRDAGTEDPGLETLAESARTGSEGLETGAHETDIREI